MSELNEAEALIWRETVSTKSADFFATDALRALLADYCRHRSSVDMVSEVLRAFKTEWLKTAEGAKRYHDLLRMRDLETRAAAGLATKLRLSDSVDNADDHDEKRPPGRPSKYDPNFCDVVREAMEAGFSKTAAAGFLRIARSTFHEWCDQYPAFSDAVKEGETLRTLKLETDLLTAADGPTVTSRIFALKNAAPDEWRDKHEHALTGPDGGPIQTQTIDPTKLSTQALTELLAARNAVSDE